MLTRLPSETIAQIIEYLPSKEDARSVALVCSALRPHAYRRLFRSFRVSVERGNIIPFQAELVLSYQHLLQYTSRLLIWRSAFASRSIYPPEHGEVPGTPLHYLWPHLTNMPRLTCIRLNLESGGYPAALSALERLDPARSITLYIADRIGRGIPMSENSLPVQLLSLHLDGLSHQMGNQLVRKCSQSLFELRLILYRALIPDLPFCPHLRKVFISFSVLTGTHDRDLTPWLSTFAQYPSLTSVSLGPTFTSVNTVHPSLLPNLQSLSAHPVIVERLVPGRPVHTVDVTAPFRFKKQSSSYSTVFQSSALSYSTVLQSLALSCVPVTTLDITIDAILSTEILVNMIRSLPMLRILQLSTGYQFPFALEELLHAIGRCACIQDIRFRFTEISRGTPDKSKATWSRDDLVYMIATIQERGASHLWRFGIEGVTLGRRDKGIAERIGWLSVESQPNLKGEWRISLTSSTSLLFTP